MEGKDFLKKVPLFSELSEEDLDRLITISREKFYPKDSVIFQREEVGNFFFLICSGRVKVVIETEDGKEAILSILYPTEFFGEMSLLDGEPRSASIVALEDTRVLIIQRDEFLKLLYTHPEMSLKILKTLSLRLRKANRQIETLMFFDAPGRIARILLDIVLDKGIKTEKGIAVDLDFTRQELGSLIGVSRETATRTLKTFEDEGIITVEKNHIIVHNLEKLKKRIY
ncbi:MAG: Crp/Fnr family transcriptional regulator [Dictyoglomaceae bacterium]|nr:Crp/Fnr family transcriptional regulator [Dictyoglomaceae bacterium]